jgi:hypothetical protein
MPFTSKGLATPGDWEAHRWWQEVAAAACMSQCAPPWQRLNIFIGIGFTVLPIQVRVFFFEDP